MFIRYMVHTEEGTVFTAKICSVDVGKHYRKQLKRKSKVKYKRENRRILQPTETKKWSTKLPTRISGKELNTDEFFRLKMIRFYKSSDMKHLNHCVNTCTFSCNILKHFYKRCIFMFYKILNTKNYLSCTALTEWYF